MIELSFAVAPGVALAADAWEGERRPWFLLVHGLASNRNMWRGVAELLAEAGFAVVAVDLRGHGRSSKPDDGYEVAAVSGDLAAVIEQHGLGRAAVAGQSWGGNVVLELARQRPDLVSGAVAVDGGWIDLQARFPSWDECASVLAPPALAGLHVSEIEALIAEHHPDWPPSGVSGLLDNFEVGPDETVTPWLTRPRHMSALRGLWEDRPGVRYPEINVPTLLLPAYGSEAEWSGDKQLAVAAAASAIPNVRVDGRQADHDVHAQHPAWVASSLIECLEQGFFA